MEKIINSINSRLTERFLLGIYTLYSVTLVLISQKQQWARWNDIVFIVCLMAAWALYMAQFKNYKFRMKLTAILMQVSVVLYAMHADEFPDTIPTFMVFVVLLSLMGVADIIFLTMISIFIIFIGHTFITHTITEMSIALSQLMNVFLLQFVVYTWVKKTDESNKSLLKVIEELKAQGETEDDIVGVFFMMFQDDKLTLEEFEDLIGLMDYELTEEFKNMSPEQQKSDEAWEENENDFETDCKKESKEESDLVWDETEWERVKDMDVDELLFGEQRLGILNKIDFILYNEVRFDSFLNTKHKDSYKIKWNGMIYKNDKILKKANLDRVIDLFCKAYEFARTSCEFNEMTDDCEGVFIINYKYERQADTLDRCLSKNDIFLYNLFLKLL